MNIGLTNLELNKLNNLFSKYSNIEKVVLYGSRAKGNFKTFSDVDITLLGCSFTRNQLNKLSTEIDDLLLPYQFDISIFQSLINPDLIEHIQRVGITIYVSNVETISVS